MNIEEYLGHIFCYGEGSTTEYSEGHYLACYSIEKFDYATLHAIERKMKELGLKLDSMDVCSHRRKKVTVRLFFSREGKN